MKMALEAPESTESTDSSGSNAYAIATQGARDARVEEGALLTAKLIDVLSTAVEPAAVEPAAMDLDPLAQAGGVLLLSCVVAGVTSLLSPP